MQSGCDKQNPKDQQSPTDPDGITERSGRTLNPDGLLWENFVSHKLKRKYRHAGILTE
jgi:hypothetical protein